MNKNILLGLTVVLAIACLVEGLLIVHERNGKLSAMAALSQAKQTAQRPSSPPAGGRPSIIMKGQKFADNPLSSKAYLIFPVSGELSNDAKAALNGWDMKTTPNKDGSTQVDLIPQEAEDIKQSFTVKQGSKLYFIEMTFADDQSGVDQNRGDDIGVLVDQDGIVN